MRDLSHIPAGVAPAPPSLPSRGGSRADKGKPPALQPSALPYDLNTGAVKASRATAAPPPPQRQRQRALPSPRTKMAAAPRKKAMEGARVKPASDPSAAQRRRGAGAFPKKSAASAPGNRPASQNSPAFRRSSFSGRDQDPHPKSTSSSSQHVEEATLHLTETDIMNLCGVHPGTEAAAWFLDVREKLNPRGYRNGSNIKHAGFHGRHLSYPPPSPSTGPGPSKHILRKQLEEALVSSQPPPQEPEEWVAHFHRREPDVKDPALADLISPSGLTKNSSRSTEDTAASIPATDAESNAEAATEASAESSTSDVVDPNTLRRHNLLTADRKLISQFDQLQEQRRLLSVKPAHRDNAWPLDNSGDEATEDSAMVSSRGTSNSLAMDSLHRGTGTQSPHAVQQTVVYSREKLPALSTPVHTGDEDNSYRSELSTRVVVLSLGPITPIYRSNYGYYLRKFREEQGGRARGRVDRQADKRPTAAATETRMENLVFVPDAYNDLDLHPTAPPYERRQRRDSNQRILPRGHSRTIDSIGGRLGPSAVARKNSPAQISRLPLLKL